VKKSKFFVSRAYRLKKLLKLSTATKVPFQGNLNAIIPQFITFIYPIRQICEPKRKHQSGKRKRLKHPVIEKYVIQKFKLGWSTEQIAGRLPIGSPGLAISQKISIPL